ncbi:hypothetical protein CVT25_012998 [Psilocybe cyanescens]|uniref:Uncharacterized protein n=1 Tax=Psilocybe cyanescens TaxID=93625 RepID=A0A409XHM5_PSICY|nr:hypothetical protein CVT25_012998 [Psilocybe cyanescens]
MLVCYIIVFKNTNFQPLKPAAYTHCLAECASDTCHISLVVFWVPFFLFETVVFFLTIRKYFQEYQHMGSVGRSVVVRVLMRDGEQFWISTFAKPPRSTGDYERNYTFYPRAIDRTWNTVAHDLAALPRKPGRLDD